MRTRVIPLSARSGNWHAVLFGAWRVHAGAVSVWPDEPAMTLYSCQLVASDSLQPS